MNNPYKILGVRKNAKFENIKKAFRKLSKKHHPDKGGDEQEFQKINAAWEILKDPEKRAHYDKTGEASSINEDSLSVQLIVDIFSDWLKDMDNKEIGFHNAINIDLVELIKRKINRMIKDVERFKRKTEASIDKLKDISKKCKGGFKVIIEGRIEEYERDIENSMIPHLEGLNGAIAALEDGSWLYSFDDEVVVGLVGVKSLGRGITERIYR